MERTKPTTVWIDGKEVGTNSNISTAQQYELSSYLSPGSHDIAIIVDNGKQAVPEKCMDLLMPIPVPHRQTGMGLLVTFFIKYILFQADIS